jgi:acetolactate synthase I/II/III large subunit
MDKPKFKDISEFIGYLNLYLTKDDIIVSDAGSSFFTVATDMKLPKEARWITSGGFAAMGAGLPMAIGCAIAEPKKRIILITGDGSLQLNIQELQTISHYKYPIKMFIINNNGYKTIRNTQTNYFRRLMGESKETGISFPSLEKICYAYDITYTTNINQALSYKEPILCEIIISV